ncbi:MAG: 50S ribosomal protein L23 [Deltaproteobacteria bacterium]|nr:50S ribosomal protein L23 [Deltaproteobacteria bacterium]
MKIYSVIQKPCLTEKGMLLQEKENKVVLKVNAKANKVEIKEAAEKLFNVKVVKVGTANMHGKQRRLGKHIGMTADWKKAYVSLAKGQKLDFLEEL